MDNRVILNRQGCSGVIKAGWDMEQVNDFGMLENHIFDSPLKAFKLNAFASTEGLFGDVFGSRAGRAAGRLKGRIAITHTGCPPNPCTCTCRSNRNHAYRMPSLSTCIETYFNKHSSGSQAIYSGGVRRDCP